MNRNNIFLFNFIFIFIQVLDSTYSAFKKAFKSSTSNNKNKPNEDGIYLCLDAATTTTSSDAQLTESFEARWDAERRPIVIRNVHKRLDQSLWSPHSFAADFGQLQVDLINCRNNRVLAAVALADFWSGFEDESMRLRDKKGRPMILKLKDWPNSDDFKHMLPNRYADLMDNMPIAEYVRRNAPLNLVSYLPASFCLPDLGIL